MFKPICYNASKDIPSFCDFIEFKTKRDALDKIQSIRASSSGAFVGEGLVLTAAHAIEGNQRAKVLYKNFVLDAEILVRLPKLDVMLLGLTERKFIGEIPKIGFSDSRLGVGQKLFGVGFPLPDKVNFNSLFYEMTVSRLKIDRSPHLFQFSGELSQGVSGASLVNDRCQVVGVAVRKAQKRNNSLDLPNDWNLGVKQEYFFNAIEKYIPCRSASACPRLSAESIARRLNQTAVVVLACD
jgi:S1-C subfamily serine protease